MCTCICVCARVHVCYTLMAMHLFDKCLSVDVCGVCRHVHACVCSGKCVVYGCMCVCKCYVKASTCSSANVLTTCMIVTCLFCLSYDCICLPLLIIQLFLNRHTPDCILQ